MLLILVVETNIEQGSDRLYIEDYIKHFFDISGVKLKFIPMSGKGNYKTTKVINKINQKIKEYTKTNPNNPKFKVIYFIDWDNPRFNNSQFNLNNQIVEYINKMNYELVYFNKNIENVFLQKDVESNKKLKEATRFVSKKLISEFDNSKCKIAQVVILNSSNIDFILSKYLEKYN